jgi:hypothetical protein
VISQEEIEEDIQNRSREIKWKLNGNGNGIEM